MSDEKKTLNDIKSGKGLPPINTSNSGSSSSGLTTKKRGQDSSGIRTDRFSLNQVSGKKGGKSEWIVQEEYEDIMRKFSLLDDFGQKAVAGVLRTEFARCQEQGSLKSGKSVSVSVKIRNVVVPINDSLSDL